MPLDYDFNKALVTESGKYNLNSKEVNLTRFKNKRHETTTLITFESYSKLPLNPKVSQRIGESQIKTFTSTPHPLRCFN